MKFVFRRLHLSSMSIAAGALALLFTVAPVLMPLCHGAQAARMARHACCEGTQACHSQVGRAPCCELQGAPAGGPMIPASGSTQPHFAPLLQAGAFTAVIPVVAQRPTVFLRSVEQAQ